MSEQLDFFGGAVPTGPPAVPTVTFYPRSYRRSIRGEAQQLCRHCLMNVRRWHDNPASLTQWPQPADVTLLKAVALITQVDGSTLELCAQHAEEHDRRENRHG